MALRWGIVSAGKISHDFVNAVGTLPKEDHQVLAVAARNLASAREFADRHGIPRSYEGYEKLAKDPEIGKLQTLLVLILFNNRLVTISIIQRLSTLVPKIHSIWTLCC